MAGNPQESLPQQAGKWGELLGAYRLFNNPAVEPAAIQQAHWQLTRGRCRGQRVGVWPSFLANEVMLGCSS